MEEIKNYKTKQEKTKTDEDEYKKQRETLLVKERRRRQKIATHENDTQKLIEKSKM